MNWLKHITHLALPVGMIISTTGIAINPPPPLPQTSLPFIENQGQIDNAKVLFHTRTFSGPAFVTRDGAVVYSIKTGSGNDLQTMLILRETLVDAHSTAAAGAEPTGAKINFLQGQASDWRANVPAFRAVEMSGVYRGIDLRLQAAEQNLEKIFTLAPGADPDLIRLRLEGADTLTVNDSGELEAATELGLVRFTRPVAWQEQAGRHQPVEVAYAVDGREYGFILGDYDPALPLVIDPLLSGTFVGGSGYDIVRALTQDDSGNIYAAGYTSSSTDFPTATGAVTNYQGGAFDAFVMKYDAHTHELLAATFLGGTGTDQAAAIDFHIAGHIFVGGVTASPVFTGGAAALGTQDGFIVSLDTSLQNPVTYRLGGAAADAVMALKVHGGHVYAAGQTASTDFPVTDGAFMTTHPGDVSAFVAKLPLALDELTAASFLGGDAEDAAQAICIDTNSHVIVAGFTESTAFPVATPTFQNSLSGTRSAFVSRFLNDLSDLPASTYLGGDTLDDANAITADISNRVYVAGSTTSTDFPTDSTFGGSYQTTTGGNGDAFITRLNSAMTTCEASTYLGGNLSDAAMALTISSSTNATWLYVAGYTRSANFPTTANVYDTTHNGGSDAFLVKFGDQLTAAAFTNSTYFGGSSDDTALAVMLAPDGNSAYIAGTTESANLPIPATGYQPEIGGGTDGFIARLGLQYGGLKWSVAPDRFGDGGALAGSPTMGWDGTVYVGVGSNLFAYNPDGTAKWAQPCRLPGRIVMPVSSAFFGMGSVPAVDTNGMIYVGASPGPNSFLQAIYPDGQTNWRFAANGVFFASPAIGPDGSIYFGTEQGNVYGVNPDGTEKWQKAYGDTTIPASPAIATNGTVYVLSEQTTGSTLYAYDPADGSEIWNLSLPGAGYSSPAIGTNGWIYAATDNDLYGIDPDGASQMAWILPGTVNTYSSPAIDSNAVAYIGGGNSLHACNTLVDGQILWSRALTGSVTSSPAVGADGHIYVGGSEHIYSIAADDGSINWSYHADDDISYQTPLLSTDGTIYMTDYFKLYALYGPVAPDDESVWPSFARDVLRTGNAGFDPRPFAAPQNVNASKGTFLDRVELTWSGVDNIIQYQVYRNTTDDSNSATLLRTLVATNMSDYTVEPGRLYYYWVRARTHVVPLSTFSASSDGGTPPSPPTGIIASKGVPTNYVEIVWNPSDYTTEYRLYRAFVNDPADASVTNLAVGDFTDFDDFTVTPGRTHYYWVRAVNAQGYISAFSDGDGIANSGGIQPSPPATFTAGKGLTSTNVPLSWSTVPYATGYIVYRSTELNPTFAQAIVTNQAPDTTAGDPRTVPFLPYHYWVRATNQYGYSVYSTSDSGYTVLLPPLSVAASGDQTNRVAVTWTVESTNATRYMIYRGATTNAAEAELQAEVPYLNTSATNFSDYSITRGAEYYYFLRARNVYGISDFSETSNRGGTFPSAPTGLSATDGEEEGAIILTWNPPASPGTRGYRLYRSTTFDPGTATHLASIIVGNREYHDTGSEPGRYYYYWATATNYLGASKFSGITSGWRPLPKPGHLSAEQGDSTSHINLTWSAARNATHYEIWRGASTNLAAAGKLENSWAELAYTDTETEAGTIYYYWLRSKNASFISAYTEPALGFRALGEVDLKADSLIFQPNVLAPDEHPTAISFRLSNRGPQTMRSPNSRVSVDLYLSTSSQFVEQDAYWLGGINLDLNLTPGSGSARSLTGAELATLAIPHLPAGHYYVFVQARHQLPSKWNDPVPANNHVRRLGGAIRIAPRGGVRQVLHDYDGDGRTDPAIYREADGAWRVLFSGSGYAATAVTGYGGPGFAPVPADYDGDGKTDPAVYREADGAWIAWLSGANYAPATAINYGGPGFAPVPADYDGDGRTDPAVYREADGAWAAWLSLDNYAPISIDNHGGPGWQPAPGGYDYDTFVDPAVYHAASGNWRIWPSSQGYRTHSISGWGQSGLIPIPGDYNGDGLNDLALYHSATGYWFIRTLAGENITWGTHWGGTDFLPAPGDYNGDGRMDLAVYHVRTGAWYIQTVAGGIISGGTTVFGGDGFVPAGL